MESISFFKCFDDKECAIKSSKYNFSTDSIYPNSSFVREIVYLNRFKHINLMNCDNIMFNKNNYEINILMPSMYSDLKRIGYKIEISEKNIKIIFKQILNGLKYIHDLNLVHRDIKPENILSNEDFTHIKICDFGSIKPLPLEYDLKKLNNDGMTLYYIAPELIYTDHKFIYDQSIDLWSLACTIWEILFDEVLFNGIDTISMGKYFFYILGDADIFNLYKNVEIEDFIHISNKVKLENIKSKIIKEQFKIKKDSLSIELSNILFCILNYDIKSRPNCDKLLNSEYFYTSTVDNLDNLNVTNVVNENQILLHTNIKSLKSISNIISCNWIAELCKDLDINIKILISTILLYDNYYDKFGIEDDYKQLYIVSCLSICYNLYGYDYISADIYCYYTDNSITIESLNECRVKILGKIRQFNNFLNLTGFDKLKTEDEILSCILLYVTGDYKKSQNMNVYEMLESFKITSIKELLDSLIIKCKGYFKLIL